ncbi:iron ABC transporter permease [Jannaschia pagri]|uniref:Iron ABC transporter permease n=1 Tax=Jannaschia pagri TaxID=2829797 RepID=A0ABQ4NR11_9RHOB|nr:MULTISPECIES: lipocalin-like domain-containing protein [unclassified Jannaschia]GIT92978.1 iron ABC transporter permease [Jannaschia sp. AI_61]GIT96813.1 iron ABC transporter permease [Jannaschia sp. AI_62]
MNVKALTLVLALLFAPLAVLAQGFAGLGQGGEGFALPQPDPQFDFPADHGAHPDYRIEWWYLTATLQDDAGTRYGIQWTLFRSALTPTGPQIWMAHMGVTTPDAHYSGEKLARGGLGQAGVQVAPFSAWLDDWQLAGDDLANVRLTASTDEAGYDLTLSAEGPLVFHGQGGYSVKSASGQASYYYSQPFYEVSGTLDLPGGEVAVTGRAWLDREWSSQPLEDDQEGWDWFSLHLDDGHRVMAFQLRGGEPYTYVSWILPDGEVEPLPNGALRLTPLVQSEVAGRVVPTEWRLQIPARSVDIEVRAVNPDSWQATLFPYWEGPVIATGSHGGDGYLEMTGYE